MDLVKSIVEFFKKPEQKDVKESPEGVCNLCWGTQEYDGKIRKLYKDKQVDVNNKDDAYTLIQKFVRENMDGYQVKDGVTHVCTDCEVLREEG